MRYAMLICGDYDVWAQAAPDDARARTDAIYEWLAKWEAAGKIGDVGARLEPPSKARTVRGGAAGLTVTDGPYVELKEVIGGIVWLEADSLDEAAEIAGTWPGIAESVIEVRPVMAMD